MVTTDFNGIARLTDSDGAPTTPVINMLLQSVSDALNTRAAPQFVANITERSALVAARTAAGRPVTASRPIFVFRQDATVGQEIEYSFNGTTWFSQLGEASGTYTALAGYQPHGLGPLSWRRHGSIVTLSGAIKRTAAGGAFSVTNPFGVAQLPTEIRPSNPKLLGTVTGYSGVGWAQYTGDGQLKIVYPSNGEMPLGSNPWFISLEGVSWII